jgi:Na+/proline symporter
MTAIDWGVLGLYLVGVAAIGLAAARRVRGPEDFFMGGRGFRKGFMVLFGFGAGTHTDQAVSVAAKTYTNGLSGIWLQWIWLFATPFYWLIAPIFRRMRALTTGDFFDRRYSASVAGLFAAIGILQLVVNIGTMLKGSGAMITAVSSGVVDEGAAIVVMTVLFTVYGMAGGLRAAVWTDFVQGILTVALSFLILPFAWRAVGGMTGLRSTIADPAIFDLVAPGDITVFYITVVAVNGLVGIVTQPHIMSNCAAGRNELDNRVGFAYGNLLKRVCTVAWTLTGLCAIALYPGLADPHHIDQIYGRMAGDLLPLVAPGLVGLFLASVLAAVMSSCDAWMIASSGLFTENIYRTWWARNRTPQHYLWVGRWCSAAVVVAAIVFALTLDSVVSGLEIFWRVQALMGIAFWVGLFWRRATVAAAWVSTLAALSSPSSPRIRSHHFSTSTPSRSRTCRPSRCTTAHCACRCR